jgi:ATP-dependent Clp protease adaptor protein ClpS
MSVAPAEVEREETGLDAVPMPDTPWVTIVWNDPINLMSYVTYVFQKVFGYAKPKAEKLMLDVHHRGRAVVSNGTREAMERDAEILHGYGLWATVSHDR